METTKRIEESPYRRISAEDEEMYAKPSSRSSPSVSNDPLVEVQVPIVKRTSGLNLPDLTSENLKSVQMPNKIEL